MKKILIFLNPRRHINDLRSISFYEAWIESFVPYFSLRPDDSYWSERRILALKYRLTMLFCFLLIFNSAYLIVNKKSFGDLYQKASTEIYSGSKELSKDFPLRIWAYLHFFVSSSIDLEKKDFDAYLNDNFNANKIPLLILRDKKHGPAELGGIIFCRQGVLDFVILDSAFYREALLINKALKSGSDLSPLYQKHKEEIMERFGEDPGIKGYYSWLGKEPDNSLAQRKFLGHALFLSAYSYFLDIDAVMEQFYGLYRGAYLGNFHIHRYGDPISAVDLEGSRIEDKFVIISLSGRRFKIVWLKEGWVYYRSRVFFY